ncbi:TPA: hypothetical protein TUR75_001862 [Streptococcus equi subsp. zooepidemicus]|uniref:hypothetical protein n=1 Tax=Streptococcus equi TaxID=1336 RepID=UPI0005BC9A62|nr:hypothetical protein [Streptococcus equi]KIS09072.1 hypothetical protein AT53_01825 [Streptococcus equi subsp. zooepidemicus Sz5]MCD3367558.1 hypothetical protein [Streptococcus equi subsp. zooepidemicus]MCD3382039.1 hypothetical protein [Streptococcus equi subsp. zooepidemicus]MCD3386540.1 hypothetical protein [Streptococcus equi subsp. zooepidemicus]MCD3420072.1 hypothetical protein [Streptococcus equi subsp. zooepidemicus]
MSEEQYLPIKESLGYKNVKQALWNIFSIDLETLQIEQGEFENFGFILKYKTDEIIIWIASTEKNKQFEYGEGGRLIITVPNPKYPEDSFLDTIYFHNLLTNDVLSDIVRYSLGKDEKSIEQTFQILKDYLDSA